MPRVLLAGGFLFLPSFTFAQSDFHRSNVITGVGGADRYLQADIGLQFAFGPANDQNLEQTGLSTAKDGDRQ